MKATVRGRDAISRYLAHEWSLDDLWDWALTFGDLPEDRSDDESQSLAGHVLAWVIEMGDGLRTLDQVKSDLASLANTPIEAISPRS
jgi:hypothetical protein